MHEKHKRRAVSRVILLQDCFPYGVHLFFSMGSHGAGKQSMRCVLFSTERLGAKEWACCHPEGFECFITAYTEDWLRAAQSLTSGRRWRQSRRGAFHCPATTPASTFTEPGPAPHEGWLAVCWTPGKGILLSCLVCLIIQEILTVHSSELQNSRVLWVCDH